MAPFIPHRAAATLAVLPQSTRSQLRRQPPLTNSWITDSYLMSENMRTCIMGNEQHAASEPMWNGGRRRQWHRTASGAAGARAVHRPRRLMRIVHAHAINNVFKQAAGLQESGGSGASTWPPVWGPSRPCAHRGRLQADRQHRKAHQDIAQGPALGRGGLVGHPAAPMDLPGAIPGPEHRWGCAGVHGRLV